jgi:hypothetical protein
MSLESGVWNEKQRAWFQTPDSRLPYRIASMGLSREALKAG